MTWEDITVDQYTVLAPIIRDAKLLDLEKEAQIVGFLFDKTEADVDNMPYYEFKAFKREIDFLNNIDIPIIPRPEILVAKSGKRYRVSYDLYKKPIARYVEIKHFLEKKTEDAVPETDNLARLLASICEPEGEVYRADKHTEYADDLGTVGIVEGRSVVVFFCLVYSKLLKTTRAYLASKIARREQIPEEEANKLMGALCAAMDGFIISSYSPTMKM
jgi:hypothetical protein